jgi:hypothetical protein
VASNKALNLLYRVMRVVLYQCTAAAIKMASLFDTFFLVVVLFAVALAAAWAIRSKQLPDGGVKWVQSSPGHAALIDFFQAGRS